MKRDEFIQAKTFIFADIRREIKLAEVSEQQAGRESLIALGIPLGCGNFLAALGLLCYTEFAGKLKYNLRRQDGSDIA